MAHDGAPSNHAAPEEIVALAAVLAEFDHGAIECIPRSFVDGYDDADRRLLCEMYRASGRPIELNTMVPLPHQMAGWRRGVEFVREAFGKGFRLHPMFAVNELGAHFSLDTTFLFDEMPTFREALCLRSPGREQRLRDPAVRARMLEELANPAGRAFVFVWQVVFGDSDAAGTRALVGRHLADADEWVGAADAFPRSGAGRGPARSSSCARRRIRSRRRHRRAGARPIVMAGRATAGAPLVHGRRLHDATALGMVPAR